MEKYSRMWRSGVSLLLALCLVVGLCPAVAFAEENAATPDDVDDVVHYVSLGDSMTNGYGLAGYDAEAGVYDYGYDSYANKFAEMLAKENGWDGDPATLSQYVEHAQLALSASRPEDINFLLRLDYESEEVSKLIDKYPTDDKVYYRCGNHSGVAYEDIVYCYQCKWDWVDVPGYDVPVDDYPAWWELVHGENWSNLIGYGDFWTWKELAEDYRFGTVATYIKSKYGTDAEKARAAELMASRPAKPRDDGSNGYETCYVAKHYQEKVAEADVISIAMGNGNFGVWLMGRITTAIMEKDGIGRNAVYKVEDALKNCSPEFKVKVNELLAQLDPHIEEYVNTMMGDLEEARKASVKDVCTYAVVSFVVNYRGVIDRILELNPDAELVLLGLMNTYAGDDEFAEEGQTTIGQILDVMFPPLNAFIAAMPTYLQNIEDNSLYQDASFYYAEEYEIECLIHTFGDEAFYNWEGVARDRFVTGLVGECDHGGAACVDATKCPDWDEGLFWELLEGQSIGGVNIVNVSKQEVAEYYKLDNDARAAYAIQNQDKAASIAIYLAIEDAVCKSGKLAPVTLATLTSLSLDASLLGTALENFNKMLEEDISAYYETATKALNKSGVTEPTDTQINDISMVLAVPVTLSNALWTDPDLCSMLAVVARNKLGNGLGAHPSVAGHQALADVMLKAYSEKFTTEDKASENLAEIIDQLIAEMREKWPNLDYEIVELLEQKYDLDRQIDHKEGQLEKDPDNSEIQQEIADLEAEMDALDDRIGELRADVTTDLDYIRNYKDSLYVALGDTTAVGESYVKELANELDIDYKNLSKSGLTVLDTYDVLAENEEDIANADLITLGYGTNQFLQFAVQQILAELSDDREPLDWEAYAGEDGMLYVDMIRGMVEDKMLEKGLTGTVMGSEHTMAHLLTVGIEAYAYCFISYTWNLPELINEIRVLNEDALVLIVGMYNPLEGKSIVSDDMSMPLGEYIDYIIDGVEMHALAYSMMSDNCMYVHAPDVAIDNDSAELKLFNFLSTYLDDEDCVKAGMYPNAEGAAYIKDQIMNAMEVTNAVQTGDANGDGIIDPFDATLILRLDAGIISEDDVDLAACDVNGDGVVDPYDATLILRLDAGMIAAFPVEE